jgi:hypothetical protein
MSSFYLKAVAAAAATVPPGGAGATAPFCAGVVTPAQLKPVALGIRSPFYAGCTRTTALGPPREGRILPAPIHRTLIDDAAASAAAATGMKMFAADASTPSVAAAAEAVRANFQSLLADETAAADAERESRAKLRLDMLDTEARLQQLLSQQAEAAVLVGAADVSSDELVAECRALDEEEAALRAAIAQRTAERRAGGAYFAVAEAQRAAVAERRREAETVIAANKRLWEERQVSMAQDLVLHALSRSNRAAVGAPSTTLPAVGTTV